MTLPVIRIEKHFDSDGRPNRWAGSRPEAVMLLVLAILFPAALWAMPPNNRHACITASCICESLGANSAAFFFVRQARDEELSQPIGVENCLVPAHNPLLNRLEAATARLEKVHGTN